MDEVGKGGGWGREEIREVDQGRYVRVMKRK